MSGLRDSQPRLTRDTPQPSSGSPALRSRPLYVPCLHRLQPVRLYRFAGGSPPLPQSPSPFCTQAHTMMHCAAPRATFTAGLPVVCSASGVAVSLTIDVRQLAHPMITSNAPPAAYSPAPYARGKGTRCVVSAHTMDRNPGGSDPDDDRQPKRLKTARDYEREAKRQTRRGNGSVRTEKDRVLNSDRRVLRAPLSLSLCSAPRVQVEEERGGGRRHGRLLLRHSCTPVASEPLSWGPRCQNPELPPKNSRR